MRRILCIMATPLPKVNLPCNQRDQRQRDAGPNWG